MVYVAQSVPLTILVVNLLHTRPDSANNVYLSALQISTPTSTPSVQISRLAMTIGMRSSPALLGDIVYQVQ